jgi:hypothetical protein
MQQIVSDRKGSGLKPISGSDSRISVPSQTYFNLSPTQAITICALIRPVTLGRRNTIISKRNLGAVTAGHFGGFLLCIDTTGNVFFTLDENSGETTGRRDLVSSANNIITQANADYYVFLSKSTSFGSASAYTLTINNVDYPLTFSAGAVGPLLSTTVTSNTHDLNILWEDQQALGGSRTADVIGYDEKLFNKVLTPAEKDRLFRSQGANIPSSAIGNLIEWWPFEDKQGTTLKGKKGNDGTLVGYANTAFGPLNQWVNELGISLAA